MMSHGIADDSGRGGGRGPEENHSALGIGTFFLGNDSTHYCHSSSRSPPSLFHLTNENKKMATEHQ